MTSLSQQQISQLQELAALAPQLKALVDCHFAIATIYSQLASGVTSRPPMPVPTYPDRPVWRGQGQVQIGSTVLRLDEQLARLCECFAKLGPCLSFAELNRELEVDCAPRYLKRLRDRFPELAAFITFPGGRGKGGYRFDIIDGEGE